MRPAPFVQRLSSRWPLFAIVLLCSCGNESSPQSRAFTYSPPTEAQLREVRETWQQRDLSARDVVLLHQDATAVLYEIRLYGHTVEGRTHYGAVTIPKVASATGYPVVLFADGLSQSNPTMDIARWAQGARERLSQFVFVIPVFRGRTLLYNGVVLPAAGDFCDAYDGATDDAIALLNVVQSAIPEANGERVMATGASRGGLIALLLAERDARITVASAASAPTDFYRAEVRDRYGAQYECQFFTGKTTEQSRQRMLASSPLHFPVLPTVRKVYLDHGQSDTTVPIWNAEEMAARLRAQGVVVTYRAYPGYGHQDLFNSPDFRAAQTAIYEEFLRRE